MPQDKWAQRQGDLFCIVLLLLVAVGVTLWQLRMPVLRFQDDGFYYLQIARNLAQGAGSTFDGVNLTNGYQPLWLLILVPIFRVAHSNTDALILTFVLQGCFYAGMLVLVFTTARLRCGVPAALFAALLWAVWMSQESFKGMEFSLHALLIGSIGLVYFKWFTPALPTSASMYVWLGVLCSIAVLARVDTLLLSALLAVTLGVRGLAANQFAWRRMLAFVLPIAVVVCGYALVNLYYFGHVAPISGVIKAAWSKILLESDPVFLTYGWVVAKLNNVLWIFPSIRRSYNFYLGIGTFGAGALWLAQFLPLLPPNRRASLRRIMNPLTPFVLYSVGVYLAYALVLHSSQSWSPWYYVIQPWLAVLLAAFALEAVLQSQPLVWLREQRFAVYGIATVGLVMLLILARQLWLIDASSAQALRDAPLLTGASWARDNLDSTAIIGAWNAGAIGYLSERRTINLDGLVNSYTFFETQRHDLCAYWKSNKITHLIDIFGGDNVLDVVPTLPAYANCFDSLQPVWSLQYPGATWRLQVYALAQP